MKTYTKQITKTENRLVISTDGDMESPRNDSNLGYFITVDKNYNSPDKNDELYNIIKSTGIVADSQLQHIAMIKKEYEENNTEKIVAIYPITKYEHGNVSYSLGTRHGFDNSNNGFYIITDKTQKEVGTKKKDFEKVIKYELEAYTKWCNGEIYNFTLYDKQGELEDSCGGFYDLESIRGYLPKEWKKEKLSDYII